MNEEMNDAALRWYPGRRFQIGVTCNPEVFEKIVALKPWQDEGVDVVTLTSGTPVEGQIATGDSNGQPLKANFHGHALSSRSSFSFATTLHATEKGVECVIGKTRFIVVEDDGQSDVTTLLGKIAESNQKLGIEPPAELKPKGDAEALGEAVDNFDQLRLGTVELARRAGMSQRGMDKRIKRLARDGWIPPLPGPHQKKYFNAETAEVILKNPKGVNPNNGS